MLTPGTYLQNRYEILERIGSGGMSVVYKARCHTLDRLVAIKVLKEEFAFDENFVSKFKMEAQSAARLSHPNIVSVYDVVDEDVYHYIVMELIAVSYTHLDVYKRQIVLIPEISLTWQTVMRFYSRFGNRVSVMNSRMSAGERYDQYERARTGDIDIVIGPRSALFAPFENLGLIIIDEELSLIHI